MKMVQANILLEEMKKMLMIESRQNEHTPLWLRSLQKVFPEPLLLPKPKIKLTWLSCDQRDLRRFHTKVALQW